MEGGCRDSLVVIPTYNEAGNLAILVGRILRHDQFHVLIIDDDSPDGTGAVADGLADEFPDRVLVLHRRGKLGLGSAIIEGLRHGLHAQYAYVFQMDADLSHNPALLPEMRGALERTDVVVGSRYVPGAVALRRRSHRRLLTRLGSLYAGTLLGVPLTDVTGGYRGYRRHVLEALDLDLIVSKGYAVQIELNHLCHQAGFRFSELPITFHERAWGRSKMSLAIVFEALLIVASLRLRLRPLPVFATGTERRRAPLDSRQEAHAADCQRPS